MIGQRVAIIGCCGSGKSTLAKRIAESKGLDYIKFDELFWMPGWLQRPEPEYLEMIRERVTAEAWTLDGNLKGERLSIVLPRADTLIWLDYPRRFVMRRLLVRTVKRAWTKEPVFHNNRESWRMSFASRDSILLFAWTLHTQLVKRYEALWPTLDPAIAKHRVRSQRELDALLTEAGLNC